MKSPKLKLALALLAMFVLGAISGVGLFSFCHFHFGRPPGPQEIQDHLLHFLTDRLDLTADEQAKIKPITADFAQKADALRQQSAEQFKQLADATDDRIAQLITPEQKAELDKVRQERDQMMQRRDGNLFFGPGESPPSGSDHGPAGAPPP
jgi:Spy/CpxP family protein refolding chaperone